MDPRAQAWGSACQMLYIPVKLGFRVQGSGFRVQGLGFEV